MTEIRSEGVASLTLRKVVHYGQPIKASIRMLFHGKTAVDEGA
jgi:hypothetical protein